LESSLNSLLNDFSPFDGSVGLPFEEVAEKYFIQSKVVYSPDFIIRKVFHIFFSFFIYLFYLFIFLRN